MPPPLQPVLETERAALLRFFAPLRCCFTRPAALKPMRKDTEKTNVEGLLGKKAVVIQKINNLAQTGQVRINDIEWMARTSDDSVTIPVDTVVIIKAVHGVKLIVEPKEA